MSFQNQKSSDAKPALQSKKFLQGSSENCLLTYACALEHPRISPLQKASGQTDSFHKLRCGRKTQETSGSILFLMYVPLIKGMHLIAYSLANFIPQLSKGLLLAARHSLIFWRCWKKYNRKGFLPLCLRVRSWTARFSIPAEFLLNRSAGWERHTESFHLLSQHKTFHLNRISLMGKLLSSSEPLIFRMTVTCILPQMLPITTFPIPDIKGKHEGTLDARCLSRSQSMLCIHCHVQFASTLRSRAAAVNHLGKAEKGEQRRMFTLWENNSMRNGDISITKSMFWILHGDFSNGRPYCSKTIWTLLAKHKAKTL